MRIRIGDKIKVRAWDKDNKEGIVGGINIAINYHDKKAEKGIEVEQYDTELDYIGTVSYDDEYGNHHWTYFNQILSVIPQEDNVNKLCDDIVHQQLFGIK
jgi:hypothetical protein